jgi:NAD(P)-dependent dehydrogenase (short-subunit alcohol dehydrogenase family)
MRPPQNPQQQNSTNQTKQHTKHNKTPSLCPCASLVLRAVFVAGSTGRLGARIVRELLGQGFKVRAGVRNADKAETFISIASSYGLLSKEELARLQVQGTCDCGSGSPASGHPVPVLCPAFTLLPRRVCIVQPPSSPACCTPCALQVVECDLERPDTLRAAIGNAGKVLQPCSRPLVFTKG